MSNRDVKYNHALEYCQGPGVVDDVVVAQFELGHALDNPLVKEAIRIGWRVVSCVSAVSTGLVSRHILDEKSKKDVVFCEAKKDRFTGEVILLKEDILIGRKKEGRFAVGCGRRGKITGLSRAARRRLLIQARNVDGIVAEATLTYPGEFTTDGRRVKRDVKVMLQELVYRGLKGMWFLEFQERGAPHFWLFLTGQIPKGKLSKAWYRIVGSGDIKHLKAGTRISAIRKPYALAAYAAKYAAKWDQKCVPEGYTEVGRFWGCFGGMKVEEVVISEGSISVVASVIRVIRRLYVSKRKRWKLKDGARRRKFKDYGKYSFVAWGCAKAVRDRQLELVGWCDV